MRPPNFPLLWVEQVPFPHGEAPASNRAPASKRLGGPLLNSLQFLAVYILLVASKLETALRCGGTSAERRGTIGERGEDVEDPHFLEDAMVRTAFL